MNYAYILVYPCIATLILYILNKKFSYKVKLVKLCGSTSKYKIALVIITLAALFCFTFFTDTPAFKNPIFVTIYFSYFYLVYLPKEPR